MKPSIDQHIEQAAKQAGGVFRSRYGIWLVAMISFVESALPVPLITDPFMVAYILVNRIKAKQAVLITIAASVIGGTVAFLASASLYYWTTTYLSAAAVVELEHIVERLQDGTFVITLLGAISPIPYTLVAIAAGFVQGNIFMFLVASIIGRSIRYGVVGYLVYWYGPEAMARAKQNIHIATIICVVLVAAFLFYKLT